jgi:hypothetical protein
MFTTNKQLGMDMVKVLLAEEVRRQCNNNVLHLANKAIGTLCGMSCAMLQVTLMARSIATLIVTLSIIEEDHNAQVTIINNNITHRNIHLKLYP